jgi:hypothetical protein
MVDGNGLLHPRGNAYEELLYAIFLIFGLVVVCTKFIR